MAPELDALREAIAAAVAGRPGSAVALACVAALPGDGAAITLMSCDQDRALLCSSDEVLIEVEKQEYTLGEGPSLEAFLTARPVLVPQISDPSVARRWPILAAQLALLPLGGLFTFPLHIGLTNVGVCSLYRRAGGELSRHDFGFVFSALDLTTYALRAGRGNAAEHGIDAALGVQESTSRDTVHQATGMLIAQLGMDPDTAFARLRGHAYGTGRTLESIADDIVNRRLRLQPDPIAARWRP
jgi:hypothetical protein